jgi:hypothetical protein
VRVCVLTWLGCPLCQSLSQLSKGTHGSHELRWEGIRIRIRAKISTRTRNSKCTNHPEYISPYPCRRYASSMLHARRTHHTRRSMYRAALFVATLTIASIRATHSSGSVDGRADGDTSCALGAPPLNFYQPSPVNFSLPTDASQGIHAITYNTQSGRMALVGMDRATAGIWIKEVDTQGRVIRTIQVETDSSHETVWGDITGLAWSPSVEVADVEGCCTSPDGVYAILREASSSALLVHARLGSLLAVITFDLVPRTTHHQGIKVRQTGSECLTTMNESIDLVFEWDLRCMASPPIRLEAIQLNE